MDGVTTLCRCTEQAEDSLCQMWCCENVVQVCFSSLPLSPFLSLVVGCYDGLVERTLPPGAGLPCRNRGSP